MSHNFISVVFETKEAALNNSDWVINSKNNLYQNTSEAIPVCLFLSTVNGFDPEKDQPLAANELSYKNITVDKKSLIQLSNNGAYVWFTQLTLSLCPWSWVPKDGIRSILTLDSFTICNSNGICMKEQTMN